ncbi:hypothetical protein PDO_4659 [Rhizobium sp. PDO1-076]|nr:hypothetical protein PDO_4659 [Rhizobium sp. PDO1-076]
MEMWNLVLFVSEAVLYFALMTTLLHLRTYIGLGVFLTALGVMHFVETYLAAAFTSHCHSASCPRARRSSLPAS